MNHFVIAQEASDSSPSCSYDNLVQMPYHVLHHNVMDATQQTHSLDLDCSSPLGHDLIGRGNHLYNTVIPLDALKEDYPSVGASILLSPLSQGQDTERKQMSTNGAAFTNRRKSKGWKGELKKCPTCQTEVLATSYAAHVAMHDPVKYNKSCPHCDFLSYRSDYVKRHIFREHSGIEKCVSPRRLRAHQAEASINSDGDSVASFDSTVLKKNRKKKHLPSFPSFAKLKLTSMTTKLHYRWKIFRRVGIFICDLCPTEFLSQKSLCHHKMQEHNKRKELHCELCNYVTHRSGRMKEHARSMHQDLPQQVVGYGYRGERQTSKSTLRMSEENAHSKKVAQSGGAPHSKYTWKSMQQVELKNGEQRVKKALLMSKENGQSLGSGHSKHLYRSTQSVLNDREHSTDSVVYMYRDGQFLDATEPNISKEWLCCQHCDYKSHRYDFFNIHMERVHAEKDDLEVKRLHIAYSTVGGLKSACISDPSTTHLKCETCHKTFPSSNGLACHVIRHNPSNWKCCPHCDFKSFEARRIETHIRNMHPESNHLDSAATSQSLSMQKSKNTFWSNTKMIKNGREGYIKCEICQKEVRIKYWKTHQTIHDPTKLVYCSYCPYSSHSSYYLKQHTLNLHLDKFSPLVAMPVDKRPSNQQSAQSVSAEVPLAAAKVEHPAKTKVKTVKCMICQKDVDQLNLDAHLRLHDPIKWIRCELCDYVCRRKVLLELHVQQFHTSVSSSLVNDPIKKGHKECPVCKMVMNEKYLQFHLLAHDPSKWMHCPHCEFVTAIPATLKRHVARHVRQYAEQQTGHAEYKDIKGRSSLSSSDSSVSLSHSSAVQPSSPSLKEESSVSSSCEADDEDSKSSISTQCKICQKTLSSMDGLYNHLRTHDPSNLMKCAYCSHSANRLTNLRIHTQRCHADKPWPDFLKIRGRVPPNPFKRLSSMTNNGKSHQWICEICQKVSGSKKCHLLHVKSHDPSLWSHCPYCDYSTPSANNVNAHIKSKHSRSYRVEHKFGGSGQRENSSDESNDEFSRSPPTSSETLPLQGIESNSGSFAATLNFAAIGKHISAVIQSRFGNVGKNG